MKLDATSMRKAWRKHRVELVPWAIGLFIYLAFMKDAAPSSYTTRMLAFLLVLLPIVALRMIITARAGGGEAGDGEDRSGSGLGKGPEGPGLK